MSPTRTPSLAPSILPTTTSLPTVEPSMEVTKLPSAIPTHVPSEVPTIDPTYSPTLSGESNLFFKVSQVIQGISFTQWKNSDGEAENMFKLTVSSIAEVDINDIASIIASDNAQAASRRRIQFARHLSDTSVSVSYSIYYTEDISQGSTPVYEDIVGRLSDSLEDGNFTTTLQSFAHKLNITSMYNVSSTTSGFEATKPKEVETNSDSSDNSPSDSSSSIAGITVGILLACSGVFYYFYYQNKQAKKQSALMLIETDTDYSDSIEIKAYANISNPMQRRSVNPPPQKTVTTNEVSEAANEETPSWASYVTDITNAETGTDQITPITRLSVSGVEDSTSPVVDNYADHEVSLDSIYGGSSSSSTSFNELSDSKHVVTTWKRRESNLTNPLAARRR